VPGAPWGVSQAGETVRNPPKAKKGRSKRRPRGGGDGASRRVVRGGGKKARVAPQGGNQGNANGAGGRTGGGGRLTPLGRGGESAQQCRPEKAELHDAAKGGGEGAQWNECAAETRASPPKHDRKTGPTKTVDKSVTGSLKRRSKPLGADGQKHLGGGVRAFRAPQLPWATWHAGRSAARGELGIVTWARGPCAGVSGPRRAVVAQVGKTRHLGELLTAINRALYRTTITMCT